MTPVAELDSLNNVVSVFAPGYIVKNDSTYEIITDHLGSVRLVVNAQSGAIRQQIDYDEFGNVLLNTNPDFQPFGYAGGLYDEQTKLVRFGARDYDAVDGRWTAMDPIFFNGGDYNLYGYVLNEPIDDLDVEGTTSGRVQLMLIGASISFAQGLINRESPLELIGSVSTGLVAGFIGGSIVKESASILAGFIVGSTSNLLSQVKSGTRLEDIKWASAFSSGVVGAIGAGFSSTFTESNFTERAVFAIGTAISDYISTLQFINYYTNQSK